MSVFRDRITQYQPGEATLRFALDKTIPVKLITEIVQFRAKENMDKKLMKEAAKVTKIKKIIPKQQHENDRKKTG